ncbi:pumilio-family RNA binding repeat containing protein [Babesia divergens]|uniref:Pumilio-family RNA binding repeat containing protein n=1 Tax=Babesia divergens TaxID=32595 RepID=A0AAD9LJB6_BABDI|nr:pumilio-family RNA binding repeat containing protein [Babesia divergens]
MGHNMLNGNNEGVQEVPPLATVGEDITLGDSCFFDMASEYSGNDFVMTGYSPTSYNGSNILDTDSTIRHSDYMSAFESFDALSHYRDFDKRMFPMSGMYMFSPFDHSDGFSNKYCESAYDVDNKNNNALTLKLNSLTESVLKQLETPVMEPAADPLLDSEFGSIGDIDPRVIERLFNAGVDVDDIVSPNMSKNMVPAAAKSSCTADNDVICSSYGRNKDTMICNNEVISKDGTLVHKNDDNDDALIDDKKNIGMTNKLARTTKRKPRKNEEIKTTSYQRGMPDSFISNVPNKNGNPKVKTTAKGYYTNLTPSWVKNAVLGNKCSANICTIAKDQAGCRMLQKLLESNDEPFIDAVLEGVIVNLVELMTDPFGNYLCQKLMSVCCESKLSKIIDSIGTELIDVALNMHGTRALQKLIEVIRTPEHVMKITDVLNSGAVELVTDLNGNHVIQTCLSSLTSDECEFIYQTMYKHCVKLATHRHGCCVMQRCIDAANDRQRRMLIEIITQNVLELVEDAYGNYVIQYTLRLKNHDINVAIVKALAPRVTEFAKQKYSSNVIERCLMICPPETRSILISRFIDAPFEVIKDLILHPFGNYVIQRVLNVAKPDEMEAILDRIQPHIDELKNASAGKRIAAKISKKHYYNDKNANQDKTNRSDSLKSQENRFNIIMKVANSQAHRNQKDGGETRNTGNRKNADTALSPNLNGDKMAQQKEPQSSGGSNELYGGNSEHPTGQCDSNISVSGSENLDNEMRSTDVSSGQGTQPTKGNGSLGLLNMLFTRKIAVGPGASSLNVYANVGFRDVLMNKK